MRTRSTGVTVAAVAAFVFALCLRAWHIGWGLPFNYDPWEQQTLDLALDMARRQSLDPGWLEWPSGALYLALGPVRVLNWLAGVPLHGVGPPTASPGMLAPGQDAHLLGGRLIVALLGAAVAALLARAAWRLTRSNTAAWVAGLSAACLPVLVDASHRVGPLGPAAFGVALALSAALALGRKDAGLEQALWAGAAVGLATGFHYAASLTVVPVLVAALLRPGWLRRAVRVLVLAATAVGVFLLTTPFAAAHPAAVARDWFAVGSAAGSPEDWARLLVDPAVVGPIPLALAVTGLLFLGARGVRSALGGELALLWSFPAALGVASALGLPAEVVATLAAPAIALLGGATVAGLSVALPRRWLTTAVGLVILAALAPVALAGGRAAFDRGAERTESMAFAWFQRQVPAGARVIREWEGPQLGSDRFQVMAVERVEAIGLERLGGLEPDYVVLGETSLRAAESQEADGSAARGLLAEGQAAARFCPDPGRSQGPRLVVLACSSRARALHTQPAAFGPCAVP